MATIRRLYKQGNSIVVSVPGWMLEQNELGLGDDVVMMSAGTQGTIQFRKWNPPVVDKEFAEREAKRKYLGG